MKDTLSYKNAVRKEEEELKPIFCIITNKQCVASSSRGFDFKMNTWAVNCPCYKDK